MDERVMQADGISPAEEAMDAVEAGERTAMLQEAIVDLSEAQQQVIIYRFVEGLSTGEVARMIGKSEGAVKSLQHRALAALQRNLDPRDTDQEGMGR